ncbi:DUF6660 family protein [Emticicia sp. 17c]|uniref:DUF6660 family protein n=1 Tax=Emticicia sp. 17c TaxID=3127704 RepID=UPI00301E56A7
MYRLLNILLSFYLLLLACMPCHDAPVNTHDKPQTSVYSAANSQASHSESDFCSPLCSCACCGTLMVSPSAEQLVPFEPVSDQTQFFTEIKDTTGFISLLWQPPQLV